MKKLFLLFSIILFSCADDAQRNRLIKALNFEDELTQSFVVKTDSVINIKGKYGIKISVKKKDLNGLISDSLKINLIELFDINDFLMANASTISNGKWLISAGAFKIDIYGDGPLELKEGKTIKIEFPLSNKEKNMELFYGDRTANGDLNWSKANLKIQNENYYIIGYQDSQIIDEELTSQYGGIETYRKTIEIDSLGFLPLQLIKSEINNVIIDKDTIRIYQKYKSSEIDALYNDTDDLADDVAPSVLLSLSKRQTDSILNDSIVQIKKDNLRIKKQNLNYEKYNDADNRIFKNIESTNLGWINVDKFAPDEEKVSINLKNIINNSRTYIIDKKNKTVLSVYKNKLSIPINRSFQIISFGLKDDVFQVFKKTVRFSENSELNMKYKKIRENQIKGFLKLD